MNDDDLKLLIVSYYEAFRTYREYGKILPQKIVQRLDEETNVIINNGDSSMWCMLWWIFAHCPASGSLVLPTESRIHTSLIAFLFGITDIDPLPLHYYCKTCGEAGFITDIKQFSTGHEPEIGCSKCGSDEQRFKLSGSDLKLKHDLHFDQKKAEELLSELKDIKTKIKTGELLDEDTLWDISRALSIFPLDGMFKIWDTLSWIAESICFDKMSGGKLDDYMVSESHWWVNRRG